MSGNSKRRVFLGAWIVALALAASIPALAIVRGTVWIGPGSFYAHGKLVHPLISFGAPVWLFHGSDSMVISILGPVHVYGSLRDDAAAIESPIYLERGAVVQRDLISLGDSVYRGPDVHVAGRVGGQMVPWSGRGAPGGPNPLLASWRYSTISFAAGLALLLICTCIALAFPWQAVLVANYLFRELARSIVAGLMGLFLFAFLVVPLGLSLFGLPFAILLAIAAAAAWLLGLTAAALTAGRFLAHVRNHEAGLLWAVVSGMFLVALIGAIPWVGLLLVGLAGATGAGALALTMIARARPASPAMTSAWLEGETIEEIHAYVQQAGIFERPD